MFQGRHPTIRFSLIIRRIVSCFLTVVFTLYHPFYLSIPSLHAESSHRTPSGGEGLGLIEELETFHLPPDLGVVQETYLGDLVSEALKSLYLQTESLDNYEVIFVNDGSIDSTESVAENFLHFDNFRYLKNKTNRGLPSACNRGIDEARGDYVTRLDADDVFEPTYLEEMSRPLDLELTDFVYCDRYEIRAEKSDLRKLGLRGFDLFELIAAGTMMRRDKVQAIGGYRNFFWEEYDLYLRYFMQSQKEPFYVPKPLYRYSIRPDRMTSNQDCVQAGWNELMRNWNRETLERYGKLPFVLR